ncbi:CLUMA_CG006043, isoform A [Clunio marinus]|uniref:CLUMA_CG006043, isoform A n=1 Tax=Clunio marinus TaxID=568069 RepID=A0A1J1I288_9DIPT|nr:CLUMA_CG006043, isoform A [Clunio marinus]
MGGGTPTKVVQITNIAPQATKDQMQALFGLLGKIDELRLYPCIRDVSVPVISRICYVRFAESSSVAIAQHMTNTVFIDRALICIPVSSGLIPEEYRALEMSANGTLVPGFGTNAPESKLPPEVVTKVVGKIPNQIIRSFHPKLDDEKLPEYPDLPVHFDERKVEETRRTILVLNHDLKVKMIDLMEHFKQAGEVKYARTAVHDYGRRIYMIEFAEQASVITALEKLHGTYYKGVYLNLHHSTQPIEKPEAKSNEAAQKEIEEAMSIVKECHNQISAVIDPAFSVLSKDKSSSNRRRSRSRSRSRKHRSRSVESRSRSKRSRSRKRSATPRESRSRRTRKRSKSHRLSRSPSRKKRSKRSTSRRPESRSRSKDRRHRRRDRDRSRGHHKRSSRNHSRSRSRDRRSKSRDRRTKSRDRSRSRHRSERKKKSHRSEKKDERKYSHSRSRSRTSTKKSPSVEKASSRSSKRRSADRKAKKVPEERSREYEPVRDYDAEEKIGLDDGNGCEKSSSKSDNMDISP